MNEMENNANRINEQDQIEVGECLTIISPLAGATMFESERQQLSKRGFQLISRVLKHKFEIVDEDANTSKLFDGKSLYVATYLKTEQ